MRKHPTPDWRRGRHQPASEGRPQGWPSRQREVRFGHGNGDFPCPTPGRRPHGAVAWLTNRLAAIKRPDWEVRVQSTLLIPGGYLLPDLIVIERLPRSRQPTSALLVVEVAQTSQARDQEKARDYAVADVPDYWAVDLKAREVIVRRRPLAGAYDEVLTYADGDSIDPLLDDVAAIAVSELLG